MYACIESDEHDDTPIIEKLYILATNPALASKVQTLTHRCHLPMPNIFAELPRMYFDADHLSKDKRLHTLLRLAIRNLVNVHTLRIVYGHWHLANALVVGFLDPLRPREVPLRKLWLESCAFDTRNINFLEPTRTTGLESIRVRRLRAEPAAIGNRYDMTFGDMKLARGGFYCQLHSGLGAWVGTTVEFSRENLPEEVVLPTPGELEQKGRDFDNAIWANLPRQAELVYENSADFGCHINADASDLPPPIRPMQWLFQFSQSSLTRLDLDWILWRQKDEDDAYDESSDFLTSLSRMRFPHLIAFQMRNAVLPLTQLPDDVFLLEDTFLAFLEAHPKIKCLAWPLDKFYSHRRPSVEVQSRCRKLIAHMSMVLTDLRLDTHYAGNGEPMTDDKSTVEATQQRIRRRRFIAEFTPHMRKIKQIKLEGGIPRDEKREILRALHYCPLEKIVFIGVSFPVGNTWGHQGAQLKLLDAGSASDYTYDLEEEDGDGMLQAYKRRHCVSENFKFEPEYGWTAEAPLLHTLALHHADTVQELKMCGYNGCPILSYLTPDTTPLLAPLLQYQNLRQLVVSFWLLTFFEHSYRDIEIIQSWLDTRSPSSTALVVVTPPRSPEAEHPVDGAMMPAPNPVAPRPQFNRWAVALKTRFTPSALAYRVANDIGPFLSPVAKARPGGVRVRASFCLGARKLNRAANDIFDLELSIGRDDAVLNFVGPREEGEKGRWWAKMEERQWF
ncbi:hypothetical protein EJ07DRAFT_93734 [Lizonia empirigonia]|nr:hypothetical protein EJ07DRAFT_93734 [Lizonia empirigonia]